MSTVAGRTWLVVAFLAASFAFIAMVAPSLAKAEETVWICKPGQPDDFCAGSISTTVGNPPQHFGFDRPEDPPVDCFYVYPTVSNQPTPNANLEKDPEVKRVVAQQARMFSRVCDVYAPMYRQETDPGIYTEYTEIAYQSALSAWKDYLENYNNGRGVILVGHSQGSATLGRLIDEEIDPNPELRERLVGAILPGANIYVPKGELVGGMYDNVPVCSKVGQHGCLVAYSVYNGNPGNNPAFTDLGSGYWAYKIPRPDRNQYEVVCANPAELSGADRLTPLINMDWLLDAPPGEVETAYYRAFPDAGIASCQREGTKHWLNVELAEDADPFLNLMIPFVATGNNWHVPEVNLAEENLVQIARNATDSYLAEPGLRARLKTLQGNLAKAQKRLKAAQKKVKKLTKSAKKAKGKRKKALKRKVRAAKRKVKAEKKRISSLKKQIAQVKRQID